jgi:acyl carrier protein
VTDTTEIEHFIIQTLVDVFGQDADVLSPAATLKGLGIDSLGGVELSLAVKKRYGVRFVAGEVKVDDSVAEIAHAVAAKLAPSPETVA